MEQEANLAKMKQEAEEREIMKRRLRTERRVSDPTSHFLLGETIRIDPLGIRLQLLLSKEAQHTLTQSKTPEDRVLAFSEQGLVYDAGRKRVVCKKCSYSFTSLDVRALVRHCESGFHSSKRVDEERKQVTISVDPQDVLIPMDPSDFLKMEQQGRDILIYSFIYFLRVLNPWSFHTKSKTVRVILQIGSVRGF
jgi:hypothetical protein